MAAKKKNKTLQRGKKLEKTQAKGSLSITKVTD